MSEETQTTETTTESHSTEADDKNVPYDRFKEVNEAKKAAEAAKKEAEQQLEQIKRQQAEKNQEYQELYNEESTKRAELEERLENLNSKVSQYEEAEQARRQTLIEQLPEERREFAEDLSTPKLEKFVKSESKTDTKVNKTHGDLLQEFGYDSLIDAARDENLSEEDYERIKKSRQQR